MISHRSVLGYVLPLLFMLPLAMYGQQAAYDSIFAVDRLYSNYPSSTRNVVYDPATQTIQVVYIPRWAPGDTSSRLHWGTSTDGGATWTSLGPLDLGKTGRDQQIQATLATASDRTPYVVWVEFGFSPKRGVLFTRDESYGAGLWRQPILLSDTTLATVSIPDLAVSPDGQLVVVTWIGDGNVYFTRSVDGGATFGTAQLIIDKTNPIFPTITPEGQALGRPSIALGNNNYVFLLAAYWKSNKRGFAPSYDYWPVYVTSSDNGASWSAPTLVPPPAGYGSAHNSPGGFYGGGVILVNNVPHFPWQWGKLLADSINIDDQSIRVFAGRLDAQGTPGWFQVSRNADPCFSTWTQGGFSSMGADAQGRIFILFQDLYNPGFWHLNVRASNDGGSTWSHIMPVGSLEDRIWTAEMARNVGADLHWVGLLGGGWTFIPTTALIHGKVNADAIFSYVPPPPGPISTKPTGGYSYTKSNGALQFAWKDLATIGTRVPNSAWQDSNAPDNPRDDGWVKIDLGFSFPFFGSTYSSVYVGVNGAMSFAGPENFYVDLTDIPGSPIEALVAPFWTDLYLDSAYTTPTLMGHGAVYHWANAAKDTLIVEWNKVQSSAANDTTITFQVIFAKRDSSITFQYLDVGTGGMETKASIGIQKDADTGVLYIKGCPLENTPYNGLAVKFRYTGVTAILECGSAPISFALEQNYPNPFNPTTTIRYHIAEGGPVSLKVFDLLGRLVGSLVDQEQSAGSYSVQFDASHLPTGVYIYTLKAGSYFETRKLMVLK